MLDDPAPCVRAAIAQALARSADAPRARSRASFRTKATSPRRCSNIRRSRDAELVDQTAPSDAAGQRAIARRARISPPSRGRWPKSAHATPCSTCSPIRALGSPMAASSGSSSGLHEPRSATCCCAGPISPSRSACPWRLPCREACTPWRDAAAPRRSASMAQDPRGVRAHHRRHGRRRRRGARPAHRRAPARLGSAHAGPLPTGGSRAGCPSWRRRLRNSQALRCRASPRCSSRRVARAALYGKAGRPRAAAGTARGLRRPLRRRDGGARPGLSRRLVERALAAAEGGEPDGDRGPGALRRRGSSGRGASPGAFRRRGGAPVRPRPTGPRRRGAAPPGADAPRTSSARIPRTSPTRISSRRCRRPSGRLKPRLASVPELLAQDPLVQAMAGVVQHDEIDVPVHGDMDPRHVAEFGMVGDRAHGPVLRLQDVDLDLGMVGQQRAAPPAGPRPRSASGRGVRC